MGSFASLGVKLFILELVLLILAFFLYAAISTREEVEFANKGLIQTADRISDVIIRSTRSAMLRNQRENVSEIIQTVAGEPGIEGIRIYNKQGETIHMSVLGETPTKVNMKAEACYGCHKQGKPLETLPIERRVRILEAEAGYRVMGLITPILNQPDCSSAICHAHPEDQKILGLLDVKMSLAEADSQMAARRNNMIILSIIVVVLTGLLSGSFAYFLVHVPVRKMIAGTREVAAGNLDYALRVRTRGEMGELADSFNQMTLDLKSAHDEARNWSETLQQRVADKSAQLERIQAHMLHAEKMVSLGRLSATVAHELNNPLAGVLTYTKLVMRKLIRSDLDAASKEELLGTLETVFAETSRCGEIVKNMLLFSRQREATFRDENLHEVVMSALRLVNHHFQISEVELATRLDVRDDSLHCDANQLKQAFIALFLNAVEAMPKGGRLEVITDELPGRRLRIKIRDTGHGIPEQLHSSVFEPFFTTKAEGSGVGLGLSVAYGVVTRHEGTIHLESAPEQGTTFVIELPAVPGSPGPASEEERHTG